MQKGPISAQAKIIDEGAVGIYRLSADARRAPSKIGTQDFWHEPLDLAQECPLVHIAPDLTYTHAPVTSSQTSKSGRCEDRSHVVSIEIPAAIPFALESENGVGTRQNPPINCPSEVDSEKRELWVRNWIDQAPDESGRTFGERVIVATKRYNLLTGLGAGHPCQSVGLKTGAGDHMPAGHGRSARSHDELLPVD